MYLQSRGFDLFLKPSIPPSPKMTVNSQEILIDTKSSSKSKLYIFINQSLSYNNIFYLLTNIDKDNDMVEIIDTFGRNILVKSGSKGLFIVYVY